ncbi:hypothetical protein QBC32DRAFT_316824 [Pseudoneurospora amorphoporcata]|uniref:Uncharacterized protein n=1 Tax=Pseudoneurospora amorphoporcata TaxID=241081 RepID=A0AAN6NPI8_9PEZI|nr:hypothetical protein QBC32DRAFT_316824 [Pseudoneurospora amorphoporcata]
MLRRLRSWFQMRFKRHRNAEDKEGSKGQEQSRPAPLLELPTFTQYIPATPRQTHKEGASNCIHRPRSQAL